MVTPSASVDSPPKAPCTAKPIALMPNNFPAASVEDLPVFSTPFDAESADLPSLLRESTVAVPGPEFGTGSFPSPSFADLLLKLGT